MDRLTDDEMDALDALFHVRIDTIAAGDLAIAAVARGEAVDPLEIQRTADAIAALIAEPRLSGTTWTAADVDRVRHLAGELGSGTPSPATRALAAAMPPMFAEDPARAA